LQQQQQKKQHRASPAIARTVTVSLGELKDYYRDDNSNNNSHQGNDDNIIMGGYGRLLQDEQVVVPSDVVWIVFAVDLALSGRGKLVSSKGKTAATTTMKRCFVKHRESFQSVVVS
jgi:hypothetical protein